MELRTKVLSEKEILKIDQASRALLMEVGVHVPHRESLEIYKKAGALVDFNLQRVRVP
jgi:trimethylamine:corrinoid methyltransferase-like protein